jgi:hypothetical protein
MNRGDATMQVITFNLTDAGWEMLVNGVPSPRFDRYMRNLKWIRSRAGAVADLFVLGPARWLAFAVALLLVTGQLVIDAFTSVNLRDAQVAFHLGPSWHSTWTACTPRQHVCSPDGAIAAAEAREVKGVLLIGYLMGVGFTIERRLQRRREAQQA